MATLAKLRRILEICERYSPGDTNMCAEHDIIYLPLMNDAPISEADLETLEELGAWKSDVDSWAVYT